ncbi:MAG TPA: Wzz/FepE/Etk N-terminal domain-containing protein [Steroidobacteraceae bacterium]|nr:Wzz/FepE/Etk N-terminal domain-containing protein [Steroidobacteraceae bacterium]
MQSQHPVIAPTSAQDELPGFGDYTGILRKRRRLLLMIALPIIALAGLIALVLPDIYRSSGLIEIEGAENIRQSGPDPTLQDSIARQSDEPLYADQYVQSLSTVVLSDKNLTQLLKQHKLYDDQDDDLSGSVSRLRGDISVDIVTVPILDPESGREREVVTAFTVSYDNRDPKRSYAGATWLTNAFLEANRQDRRSYAAGTAKFYASEAERMRKHVGELERKLAEFKAKNLGQLPELNDMNMTSMDRTENEINNVETQLQGLRRERVFLVSQLQTARSTGPETASLRTLEDEYKQKSAIYDPNHPDLISLRRQIDMLRNGGSPSGMTLRQQLQQQRSILAEARQRYGEDHPDIKRMQRTIESLEARIKSGESADTTLASDSPMAVQLQTQLNATDTQIGALQQRAVELHKKMTDLETRMTSAPQVEREYQTVTRDLTSARTKFDELLKRQMDADVSEAAIAAGSADKFRIKGAPTVPNKPAKPKRLAIFAVAVALALMIGITSVVMAQLLDPTVRGVRDIRDILDVAPLTAVPVIEQASRNPHRRMRWAFSRAALVVAAITVGCAAAIPFIA